MTEKVWAAVIAVALSIAGGLSRLLNLKDKEALKIAQLAGQLFIAAFIGIMVFFIAEATKITLSWACVIAGLSGWVGPRVIDWFLRFVESKTGIKLSDKDDKNTKGD